MKLFVTAVILLVTALFSKVSISCEGDCVNEGSWALGMAVGMGKFESPLYGGDDLAVNLLPAFYYYGEQFYIENTNLGYVLHETHALSFKVRGKVNTDGVYFNNALIDSVSVAGLLGPGNFGGNLFVEANEVDRDVSYMAGFESDFYLHENVSITLNALHDVTGVHNGYSLAGVINLHHQTDNTSMFAEFGPVYSSQSLTQYYYGLSEGDGVSYIDYEVDSSVGAVMSFGFSYRFNPHYAFIAQYNRYLIGQGVKASPLVEHSESDFWFVGFSAQFGSN